MKYHSLNEKLYEQFGCKVYKLALSGGMTCPNRDGTLGDRGCIFCSGGSGAFAEDGELSVYEQIEAAKARVSSKIKSGKYIAYFQSFTNTYAPAERLRDIFTQAAEHPDIAVLSVGTRPDCLQEDKLQVLEEVGRIKPLWVELGLQTVHESTAKYIRRGYTLDVYDEAVKKLHGIGAEAVVHVILGLPGESREMMKETVRYVGDSGADGIKLQLLHVLKGTDLQKDYERGLFKVLELDEYTEILKDCLSVLPPHVTVHRLTGDGAKKDLIAPLWSADKKRVLNAVKKALSDTP